MLNLNNVSLLIILLITILLIHINYKKNHIHSQRENFQTFNERLKDINTKIENEFVSTKEISDLTGAINENNNQKKCFIKNKKTSKIRYEEDATKCDGELEDDEEAIIINPITDLKKLRELNNEIKNTKVNINPILQNVDSKIKEKRINKLRDYIDSLEGNSSSSNIKNIKQIKNNLTGKSLNVEKVKPNDENDSQYYIYLNSVNDDNNEVEYRCLSYNKNDVNNPYETKKCDKNDEKQKFELDKMILTKKCYDYPNPDMKNPNDIVLEECEGARLIKLENKSEFIEKINNKISDDNKFFHLTENNIFTVPKEFSFISPLNKNNECLTIDQEGISFQDCINNPSQQWNYSNENISC